MVEDIAVVTGNVQVCVTVVVVVGSGYSNTVAFAAHSGAIGYIGKSSIVIVVIQPIVKIGSIFHETRKARSVGEENVEITVVVIVE